MDGLKGLGPKTFLTKPMSKEPFRTLTFSLLEHANIPPRYRKANIEAIPKKLKYRKILEELLQSIATWVPKGQWLAMTGGIGVGKTSAAAILAKACLSHGGTSFFARIDEIIDDRFNESLIGEYTFRERLQYSNLLVIDDLGANVKSGDFNADVIESILRMRYDNELSVIITTNLKMQSKKKDEMSLMRLLGEKSLSMLADCGKILEFRGDYNWRASNVT